MCLSLFILYLETIFQLIFITTCCCELNYFNCLMILCLQDGKTAQMYAVEEGLSDCAKVLKHGANYGDSSSESNSQGVVVDFLLIAVVSKDT